MPIYEYQCRQCGERSEALQRFADPPLSECGQCGGELRKLISAPAFQFKGTGWYVTDYAKKGRDAESGSSSDGSDSAQALDSDSSATKIEGPAKSTGKDTPESAAKKESTSAASEPKAKKSSAS